MESNVVPMPGFMEKLAGLSDLELQASAERCAAKEHQASAEVIAHIAEISRRELHLELGYKNLFEYVADRLGFQGGSAGLRIHVAKKARDCPLLLEAIWKGELCLTGAALLVPHLNGENAESLIRGSARKSTREIEELVRTIAPLEPFEPGIRKAPAPAGARARESSPVAEPREAESRAAAPGVAPASTGELALLLIPEPLPQDVPQVATVRKTVNLLQVATPETYNFRFSAGKAFRDKFERLAEVLGARDPVRQMGEILEKAVDCLLERKDPRQRRARRLRRQARRRAHLAPDVDVASPAVAERAAATSATAAPEPAPVERTPIEAAGPEPAPCAAQEVAPAAALPQGADTSRPATTGTNGPRRPTARDWDEALERAGHRCEYVGTDGRRCTARTGLQPDHYPVPWSVSRSSDPENIRVHCAAHNSLTAKEYFGEPFIQGKMAEARAARQAAREAVGRGQNAPRDGTGDG